MTERPDPAWLMIAMAEEARGIAAGEAEPNPRILEYLATCTDLAPGEEETDDTAWCAAFVNWCLTEAGEVGLGSCWARLWSEWGEEDPRPGRGTVVVWHRRPIDQPPGPFGHISFLLEDRGDTFLALGGNQADQVCQREYPRDGELDGGYYSQPVFRRPLST